MESFAGIDNTVYPISEYSFFQLENDTWISVSPYSVVLMGFESLMIRFESRITAILTRPNSMTSSLKKRDFSVLSPR